MEKMATDCVVVHYSEIGLRGKNRPFYESQLCKNIVSAAGKFGIGKTVRLPGRIVVQLPPSAEIPPIVESLRKVFGVAYFAPGKQVALDIEAISAAALSLLDGRRFASFRVNTKREQKNFPLDSVAVSSLLGERIQRLHGVRVDLKNAELTVHVEIFYNHALVYIDRTEGPGGLPVGTGDRAVSLISSGIDSPVAAYKIMRRGVRLTFVHFHSMPYTSAESKHNVERLVQLLTAYQFRSTLYFVPFLRIQQEITAKVLPSYRVIHYRRAMLRIAEKIAHKHRAKALVTGDNVAQVASQTLPNLRAIDEATKLPVLRPLAGYDKQEIIREARVLATYEISTRPYDDCCSLFVPSSPETRANLELVHSQDAEIEFRQIIEKTLAEAEMAEFFA